MKKLFTLILILLVPACHDDPIECGGPCEFTHFDGVAVITSIGQPEPGAIDCPDAVQVMFDFVPDDPTAPDRYRFPHFLDTGRSFAELIGANPNQQWVADKGIAVGNQYRSRRNEIITGTCPPYVIEITGLDLSDWRDYCK